VGEGMESCMSEEQSAWQQHILLILEHSKQKKLFKKVLRV
jgi:hypothetical protein